MKIKLLLLVLITSSLLNAQTLEQRDNIIANYNLDETRLLMDSLKIKELDKKERIEQYITLNPKFKKRKNHEIFDIIDNKPVYLTADNNKSSITTRSNSLFPGGSLGLDLEGEDMIIGIWEPGYPLKDHVEFLDESGVTRISYPDTTTLNPSTGDNGDHATHVAGTLAANGISATSRGMAPKSTILAHNSNQDNTETSTAHQNSGMLISNHSYGVPVIYEGEQNPPDWYMGCYSSEARIWDQVLHANPYLLQVFSAGNAGNDSYPNGLGNNLDKITAGKNAKNIMIVASANAQVNPITSQVTNMGISSFSSQGPTDDGRIKPDITGRGEEVNSASNVSTTSYMVTQGTSMAAPNVAGSLLLLQEYYNDINSEFMKSATLKGLVCHTATDDAENPNVAAVPFPGPDPYWGWGLLNTEFAAQTITNANNSMSVIDERTLTNGEIYTFTVNISGSQKLMATICWTDIAGNTQENQLNSPNAVLMNDLDLRIFDSSNNEYFPWKLDTSSLPYAVKGDNIVDNIERVEIEAPTAGQYTITISHKSSLASSFPGSGPQDQDYSIIVTGADMTLSNGSNELPNLMVWPNPAKEMINYQFASQSNQTCLVNLIDLQGRVVYSQNVLGGSASIQGAINTSSYSKGVYFLCLNQGNQKIYKKVLLQ
tara:strand:- start:23 stop:1990 length:1968 start_codon:yes stop_codon:yes gene_type:complete